MIVTSVGEDYTKLTFQFILFIALALIFGYFATKNTQDVSLVFGNSALSNIPLYVALCISFLIGLTFSWIVSLFGVLASALKIRGKNNTIKDANSTINDLTKRLNDLEIENTELKEQRDEKSGD